MRVRDSSPWRVYGMVLCLQGEFVTHSNVEYKTRFFVFHIRRSHTNSNFYSNVELFMTRFLVFRGEIGVGTSAAERFG